MTYTWQTSALNIGGGGWVVGGDVQTSDDTIVCKCDTYGAYWWNGTRWIALLTFASMPVGSVGMVPGGWPFPYGGEGGVYEIRVARSNTNRAYMMFAGYVWRTDNLKSAPNHTWTQTAFSQIATEAFVEPNIGGTSAAKMAVDPANPDVCYVSCGGNSVFYTTDAGATWGTVTGVPASTNTSSYGCLIAFDRSSAVVSGKTSRVVVFSPGNGYYQATSANTANSATSTAPSFSAISGSPTATFSMIVDSTGRIWGADYGGNTLNKYASGAWTTPTIGNGSDGWEQIMHVAENPVNGHIIIQFENGSIKYSSNGITFSAAAAGSRTATDIPWLANTTETYMSPGKIIFTSTGRCIFFEGIGVWYTDSIEASPVPWTSMTLGIEQLVGRSLCVPPGGRPILACADRQVFRAPTDPTTFPTGHGIDYARAIEHDNCADYAANNTSYVATDQGYSSDGGVTWHRWADRSLDGSGGAANCIACGSSTNLVRISGQDVYVTTDGGTTWTLVQFSGVKHGSRIYNATSGTSGRIRIQVESTANWVTGTTAPYIQAVLPGITGFTANSYTVNVIDATHADLVGTTFAGAWSGATDGSASYAFNYDNWNPTMWSNPAITRSIVADKDPAHSGVFYARDPFGKTYKSTGGSSWTQQSASGAPTGSLRCVFGQFGHIWGSGTSAANNIANLKRSLDGGVTWTAIPNVTGAVGVGFGAPDTANGATYPTVFIEAWVTLDGGSTYEWGVWYSTNGDQTTPTWTKIVDYPNSNFDFPSDIDGDPSVFGNFYVSMKGSGWTYGALSSPLSPPPPPPPPPGRHAPLRFRLH
jgi:hypothetical protein